MSVPFKRMEHLHDSPEAISYMLADNKLTEKSDWNYGKLETNFNDLKVAGFDVTLTGFEDVEVKELQFGLNFGGDVDLNDKEPLPEPKLPKEENHVGIVKCPKCGEEFEPNN